MTFTDLGLCAPILKAVEEQGYTSPSPIQEQAIPAVLTGKDVMAAAQTGTGKTAGFTLPILDILAKGERARANQVRVLILTPTRELAAQVAESVATYGKHLQLRSTAVFGGVKINPQMMRLRKGVDVLVATPGRLLDLFNQNAIKFKQLEMLVLDEADRMLDMGFIHDIKKILKLLPEKRQNLMFSATFSGDIRGLAKRFVHDPIEIAISPKQTTAEAVKQWMCPVDKKQKPALLEHLIHEGRWEQVLVFTRTKHGANKLAKYLDAQKIRTEAIHGNKSQGARTRALTQFKEGSIRVLVATDIAARGLDIDLLPHVVNVDLPNVAEDYVHRIGRTGRAGAEGEAVSIVCADEFKQLLDIERLLGHPIERKLVDGFEPVHDVPASDSKYRPPKKKPAARGRHQHQDGQRPRGQRTRTDGRPKDESSRRKRSEADGNTRSEGGRSDGRRSRSSDGQSSNRRNEGNRSNGERSGNRRFEGNRSSGERSGNRRSEGNRSSSERSGNRRSEGSRSSSERSGNTRSTGNRSSSERSGNRRPEGNRKPSGNRKPGGRANRGPRKPRRD